MEHQDETSSVSHNPLYLVDSSMVEYHTFEADKALTMTMTMGNNNNNAGGAAHAMGASAQGPHQDQIHKFMRQQ